MLIPFTPHPAGTKTRAVTEASASVALDSHEGGQVLVQNAGSNTVFVEFGASTVTAAVATGLPIQPGQAFIFTIGQADTHIAAIAATGLTSTVYATMGDGQ